MASRSFPLPKRSHPLSGQSALLSSDLLTYYRSVSQSPLTVVDVETTGSVACKSRVIEISVLQGSLDEGLQHQETHLINVGVRVPQNITQITGITPSMLVKAPYPEEVWPELLPYLEQGVLTAHNVDFDYAFIQAEYRQLEMSYSRPAEKLFCTVLLSRLLLADLPSRSLPDLVQHFGFDVGRSHRAEADTQACWLLANYLLTLIREEPDEILLARFAQQWVRLKDAAKLLGLPKSQVRDTLNDRGAECRTSRRNSRFLYRRGDIENLYQELNSQQFSLEGTV
ncbi:MAG: 3'-5' exonuclease [Cyanobacteria bacterium Co-bin8]|nr:3'-5' exonuclease [Cyanobacteria bacterium Co-bin8]